jgi:preprotein translocase subunit SecA
MALALGIESGFRSRVPFGHLAKLDRVNALRDVIVALSDEELAATAVRFRERRQAGEPLDSMLPEMFARVREATRRALGIEHFDVQILGGAALESGAIAELATGEGKTITAALAAALFAIEGAGVHVATTNAYLAARDAEKLRPVFERLGFSVGVVRSVDQPRDEKRAAYAKDITYGHAETFAFDWLEDQLVVEEKDQVMRGLANAIVDEADDVLIDTAQMPLILSGAPEDDETFGEKKRLIELADEIVRKLDPKEHLEVEYERDSRTAVLTDAGVERVEALLDEALGAAEKATFLYTDENIPILHRIQNAIHAHFGLGLDREYVGDRDAVTLVSSATGHPQPKSKWRHGLMEAVTVKEGRTLTPEATLVGEITYQNFFRMYGRLSGMTGTAIGAKEELGLIYGKKVIQIPTHAPVIRADEDDRYFAHPALRNIAAIADLARAHARGQPVLMPTASVEESKRIHERLARPILLVADVAVASPGLLAEARRWIAGAADLPDPKDEPSRERMAEAIADLLDRDPDGRRRFVDLLESKGVEAAFVLEHLAGFPHEVLNAETHEREAIVISKAGAKGAVTDTTQMAGRGVDIPLGEGVEGLGGLRIIGIGHQTNSRKDAQVRGRAGRQGQPGSSCFYVSPDDAVFSFLPARKVRALAGLLHSDRVEQPKGALLRAWQAAVTEAQDRSEGIGREIRKHITELDAIIQVQRKTIMESRREVLRTPDLMPHITDWILEAAERAMEAAGEVGDGGYAPELVKDLLDVIEVDGVPLPRGPMTRDEVLSAIEASLGRLATQLEAALAKDANGGRRELEDALKRIVLDTFDYAWVRYQQQIESMRDAAELHVYRQTDPKVVFRTEASKAFMKMIESARRAVIQRYVHAATDFVRKEALPMAKLARELAAGR